MKLLVIEWANALNVVGFSFIMVFLLLLLIVFILTIFGKIVTSIDKASQARIEKEAELATGPLVEKLDIPLAPGEIPGEVLAAISMALHSYYSETHDQESNILTIKKVNKQYSPWNSKIYGLNVFPQMNP